MQLRHSIFFLIQGPFRSRSKILSDGFDLFSILTKLVRGFLNGYCFVKKLDESLYTASYYTINLV